MKRIKTAKIAIIMGTAMCLLTACGSSERKEAVKAIEQLEKDYIAAEEHISVEKKDEYALLGESIQALVDITEEDSGELDTEEQIQEANQLVEEFQYELNQMMTTIEEETGEETENQEQTEVQQLEFSVTFRNDSATNLASLSIVSPETGTETELDSFESGKKIETTVKVPVEELTLQWYVYNEQGECVQETTTDLVEAKEGVIIYYTDDGVYTENY